MKVKQVFDIDPDLKVREELVSIHALNPFTPMLSSARSYMFSSHLSQAITLNNSELPIIQTGLEKQLKDNTFSIKAINDCRVTRVIRRYRGLDVNTVNITTEYDIVYEDLVTGKVGIFMLPYFHTLHQYFGFRYVWNTELIETLSIGDIIPAGTVLADSPNVKNDNYGYGLNVNVGLVTIPDVSEDGVVITQSLADKLSYTTFEKRIIEFGSDSFPLNLYGDEDNYKPFPEIGERVNDDSVIMVLRKYDDDLAPALLSKKDVTEFNPMFDKAVYVKSPGKIKKISGKDVESGVVVDIKIHHNPKFKKEVYTGTSETVTKYINSHKKYYEDVVSAYTDVQHEHYRRYGNNDIEISEEFHRLVVEGHAILNDDKKINYSYRNEILDIYRMEITIAYVHTALIGSKLTDRAGSKGVVVSIIPDAEAPVDKHGNRAEILMDPSSVPSRMNPGRLYEMYFNALSRNGKRMVIDALGGKKKIDEYSDTDINNAWVHVIGVVKLLDTEQYTAYSAVSDMDTKRDIINDIIENEFYLLYKISSDKKPYQIVLEANDTIYAPPMGKLLINNGEFLSETKNEVMIAPSYIMLLAKTADNFLSTPSARTNHYGFPIGVTNVNRYRQPFKSSPTKAEGETETRLYLSNVGRIGAIEMKDRSISPATHEHIYKTLLDAKEPTNIELLVDRNEIPYGDDVSLVLLDNIYNSCGIKLTYQKDTHKLH